MTTGGSSCVRVGNNHNLLPDDEWAPLIGWPLKVIGEFADRSGQHELLAFVCRSRPRWRQALFLALAHGAIDDPASFLAKAGIPYCGHVGADGVIANTIPAMSPHDIVDACFEARPMGLLGVLGKLGFQTLSADAYRHLASWHAPEHAMRYGHILQKMTVINEERIKALAVLNPVLTQPALLPFIRNEEAARELNAAVDLIAEVCSEATGDALRASARDLQGQTTISAWCESWLRRADRFPAPPFAGDAECFPLTTADQVIEAGQRFKNCLGTRYLAPAIGGSISIVEFGPGLAIALLLRLHDDHWFFLGCHAPRNKPVPEELVARVEKKVLSFSPNIHARSSSNRDQILVLQKYLIDDSLMDLDMAPFEF